VQGCDRVRRGIIMILIFTSLWHILFYNCVLACLIKEKKWEKVIEYSDKVIIINKTNFKHAFLKVFSFCYKFFSPRLWKSILTMLRHCSEKDRHIITLGIGTKRLMPYFRRERLSLMVSLCDIGFDQTSSSCLPFDKQNCLVLE
jgi:pentatricopeptide repeat protein